MIRVHRGPEPKELAEVRPVQLAVVRKLRQDRRDAGETKLIYAKEITGYGVAKPALVRAQRGKCCYCEWEPDEEYDDVEHVRPKTEADRRPGGGRGEGYWWLAWTWDNLLFCCKSCDFKKGTRYPLAPGSVALRPDAMPPGQEQPLLIDPSDPNTDPYEHIRFLPVTMSVDEEIRTWWLAFPRGGSVRGFYTTEQLKLRRNSLLKKQARHIRFVVEPAMKRIHEAMRAVEGGEPVSHLRRVWSEQVTFLTDPDNTFIALSCDVLDYYFPEETRQRFGLPRALPPQ